MNSILATATLAIFQREMQIASAQANVSKRVTNYVTGYSFHALRIVILFQHTEMSKQRNIKPV